jgi:predicted dehydrogenase
MSSRSSPPSVSTAARRSGACKSPSPAAARSWTSASTASTPPATSPAKSPPAFSAYTHSNPADPRFQTVEENLNWITRFPSGILASCETSYSTNMDGYFRVYGSKGWLEVNPAFVYEGLRLTANYQDLSGKRIQLDQPNPEKDPIHFTREADHFSNCILNNKTPKTPGEEGLRDMQCIREIYRSAGITMA